MLIQKLDFLSLSQDSMFVFQFGELFSTPIPKTYTYANIGLQSARKKKF
jgi:hypothetical protein